MTTVAEPNNQTIKIPKLGVALSVVLLAALVAIVVIHFSEAKQFALILAHAEPQWIALAIALQLGTYFSAGSSWNQVIQSAGYRTSLSALARLSVERLSIDQLVPSGGIAGSLVAVQTMRRLGLPYWLAMEALLVDTLSYNTAYAFVAVAALVILGLYHDITPVILYLVGIFAVLVAIVPITIVVLLAHKEKRLPHWLMRFGPVAAAAKAVQAVSIERIRSPKLLTATTLFSVAIFVLDALTLWTMMQVVGAPVSILTAFVALVIASIAGTVSFLPGGIGGFEVASVATLTLLGAPVEAALVGTFLLRGLTLWIPLIPGLVLARRDIGITV